MKSRARRGQSITVRLKNARLRKKLQVMLNRMRILSCEQMSERSEKACLKNAQGKMTIHTRTVSIMWCCPCEPDGGGECAGTKLTSCCQITHYDPWVDTKRGCGKDASHAWLPEGPVAFNLRAECDCDGKKHKH